MKGLLCCGVAFTILAAGSADRVGRLAVGGNVLVSGANRDAPHEEVVACASPRSPTLLVASMASRRGQWVTFLYRSTDGGTHWTQVLETTKEGMWGDPTCAFAADGRAYYGGLWTRLASPVRGMRSMNAWVYASADGGRSWPQPPSLQMAVDRPFLSVDPRGRFVYYSALSASESLTGANPAAVQVDDPNVESALAIFVSTDGGLTFNLAASPRHGRSGDWVFGSGNSVVAASGEVVTLFRVLKDRFSGAYAERVDGESILSVLRTAPGGEPTEPVVPIGAVHGPGFPALAVDATREGRYADRLYAVAADGTTIVLYRSADEGRTWHGPTLVATAQPSDASTDPTVFNPGVAVNRDGIVAVGWAEGTRSKAIRTLRTWTYRMTASWDGGETFVQTVDVSSARHLASRQTAVSLYGAVRRDGPLRQIGSVVVDTRPDFGGDTFGLTATVDGVFHAAWTDNRTGVPQVWTAAVRAQR